jgi:hypothetical protein
MPHLTTPELLFFWIVLTGFVAFIVALASMQLYTGSKV